jgi:hypothetical protein
MSPKLGFENYSLGIGKQFGSVFLGHLPCSKNCKPNLGPYIPGSDLPISEG